MPSSTCLRALLLSLFVLSLTSPIATFAACSATTQDVLTVGNTATDSGCSYQTIQQAIDASTCPAGTRIYITSENSYTNQHLVINKNVSLIGRSSGSSCGSAQVVCAVLFPCPTSPLETINGNSGSVIQVRGTSNVVLQYLTIKGGQHNGGDSGGGIRVEGKGKMFMLADNATVFLNHALGGYGGGVQVLGSATAYIGSPGYGTIPTIATNDALYGGGVAASGEAKVYLFTTDPTRPIRIENNTASNTGGALHVLADDYAEILA